MPKPPAGEDRSPPLGWTGAPAGTGSFVLLCDDPDAPAGIWHHWAAYDIAADCVGLAEGAARRRAIGAARLSDHARSAGHSAKPRTQSGPRSSGCPEVAWLKRNRLLARWLLREGPRRSVHVTRREASSQSKLPLPQNWKNFD
ncbi:hypothetical protein [Mesorhizobium sp. dw_380]|uniref:YbhB/YbcL family Raf kinase inhibitor-like protein n=1 Tax=Mesorhizobium sp. dw_380 TaxID=2812001 RepID=UPI00203293AE|nr:hypothetical protein [Mesorhizobium sp. dw_380]